MPAHRLTRQRLFGEVIGSFILVLFGVGPTAKDKLSNGGGNTPDPIYEGLGWWFGVLTGIILVDKLSGAHLNPVVTLAIYLNDNYNPYYRQLYKKHHALSLKIMIYYMIAQTCGAFLSALVIYLIYFNFWYDNSSSGDTHTINNAKVFVNFPQSDSIENWQSFLVELISTTILLISIFGTIEPLNGITHNPPIKGLIIGAIVFVIMATFSGVSGPSMNPARDFGPRIFLLIFGWGGQVFSYHDYYAFIPICVPFLGSFIGPPIYYYFLKKSYDRIENNRDEDEVLGNTNNDKVLNINAVRNTNGSVNTNENEKDIPLLSSYDQH